MRRKLNRQTNILLRVGYHTLIKFIIKVIPENRSGDKLVSFINFVDKHRRFPTKSLLFNDVLYQIMTTNEIIDPLRIFVSDKEFVKLYVKAVVGEEYNVPTIDVLRNVKEVEIYDFPANCCIKATQTSGSVILRKNNETIDIEKIKSWFSINYYRNQREANYKTLKPKVIVEPLLFNNPNLIDYKFFCYKGKPNLIQVDVDRYIDHRRKFFDSNWKELDFSTCYKRADKNIEMPDNFDQMLNIASKLSAGFSFVRVDIYSDGKSCMVGEITNCSGGAGEKFIPSNSEKLASEIVFNCLTAVIS